MTTELTASRAADGVAPHADGVVSAPLGAQPGGDVASFDVFDTVLARLTGSPRAHFVALGKVVREQLRSRPDPAHFARLRVEAEEEELRGTGGVSGLRLEHIAAGLARRLGEPDAAQLLHDAELTMEREICRPCPPGVAALERARAAGRTIAFVSDTYLSADELADLLAHHGLLHEGDHIVVSSDGKGSKHDGRLYAAAAELLRVRAGDVQHHGNDHHADVRNAGRHGVRTVHVEDGNLTRYERLLDAYPHPSGMTGALAGASRAARLELAAQRDPDPALDRVACGVAGPLVVGYLLWALHRAQEDGVRRLLFASREGILLADVARTLVDKLGLGIECRYLPGSRASWAAGVLGPDTFDAHAKRFVDGAVPHDAVVVLQRMAVPYDEAVALAAALPAELRADVPRGDPARVAFVRALLRQPAVAAAVARHGAASRARALRWFEQEGLFDGTPTGVVDPGTGATLLEILRALCGERIGPMPGYYLGLRAGTVVAEGEPPHCFAFDLSGSRPRPGWQPVAGAQHHAFPYVMLYEMFCAAAVGSAVGYREVPDGTGTARLEVVHRPERLDEVAAWGIGRVGDAVRLVAEHLLVAPYVDWAADCRDALDALLWEFHFRPAHDEAVRWGAFPLEDGWGDGLSWQPWGAPFRLPRRSQWADALRNGKRVLKPHRHYWFGGGLAASHPLLASRPVQAVTARLLRKLQR